MVKVYTQDFNVPPSPPEINFVTVNNQNGNVLINWNISSNTRVDGYILFWYNKTRKEAFAMDTVRSRLQQEVILNDPRVNNEPVAYVIASYIDTLIPGNIDRYWDGPFSDPHTTIHISTRYDTCNNAIDLTRTDYSGWETDNLTYSVIVNNQVVGTNIQSSFRITDVNQNNDYEIKVTTSFGSLNSISNLVIQSTDVPDPPSDMIPVLLENFQGGPELSFSLTDDGETNQFYLNRENNNKIETIDSFLFMQNYQFTDRNISSSEKVCYTIQAIDQCNRIVDQSEKICNLMLSYSITDGRIELTWDTKSENNNRINSYTVYKSSGNGFDPISTTSSMIYTDANASSGNSDSDAYTSYYIEGNYTYNFSTITRSNIVSVNLLSYVNAPEAFTPNADGTNDMFIPQLLYIPDTYRLSIYNNWGNLIYQTSDYTRGWNGTNFQKKSVPEGSYIYIIEYTLSNGITGKNDGQIIVVYP